MTRTGRPPASGRLLSVLLAVRIVALEQRLTRGWDWLNDRPDEDRPGQPHFDRWLALLTEYQNVCRAFHAQTGRRWTFETRALAEDDEE